VIRRTYREVGTCETPAGHNVLLDGRALLTPAKRPLALPSRALAEAIAAEWAAQEAEVKPRSMPLMRLAATALDRIAPDREMTIDEIAAFAGTDLLCYRAEEPPELVARQEEVWGPILEWLRQRYDAHLGVTRGVKPVAQSGASLARLRAVVAAEDAFHLAALQALTSGLGSLALALAVRAGAVQAEAAFAASQLDESFQNERWGVDEEAMLRREESRRDIMDTARFLAHLRC